MDTAVTSKWRAIGFILPIVIGVGLLFIVVSGRQPLPKAERGEPVRFVRIIEVAATRFIPIAEGYGSVQPGKVWAAVSQVSGRVIEMHPSLRNGGIISAGSELIRIDPDDYELKLTQANNELAELNVQGTNAAASFEIEKRNLALAEKEFKRRNKLASQGTISKSSADESERAMLSSRALVQNLQNTLSLLPIQRKLLESKITQAERDLANTRISAPFNLRVAGLAVEQQQFVSTGQTLFQGDSLERVEITARVAVGSLKKLFINQPALPADVSLLNSNLATITGFRPTVRLDIGGDQQAEWQAEFVRISDSVDAQTQTIGIVVAVDNPMEKIIPGQRPPLSKGMFVQVSIAGHPQADSLVIPRSVIRNNEIYLVDANNRLQTRNIIRRYDQQQFSVIESGLTAGDKIVVSDLAPAVDGMLLQTEVDLALQNSLIFGD